MQLVIYTLPEEFDALQIMKLDSRPSLWQVLVWTFEVEMRCREHHPIPA